MRKPKMVPCLPSPDVGPLLVPGLGAGHNGEFWLLTSTKDAVDRWREYFEDLVKPTDTHLL